MPAGSTRARGGRLVRRWTERDARAALDELEHSDVGVGEFARSKGVSTQRILYWKKRLGQRQGTRFVQVELPVASLRSAERQIEIVVDGVVVRVREDLEVEQVARIVEALCRRAPGC